MIWRLDEYERTPSPIRKPGEFGPNPWIIVGTTRRWATCHTMMREAPIEDRARWQTAFLVAQHDLLTQMKEACDLCARAACPSTTSTESGHTED